MNPAFGPRHLHNPESDEKTGHWFLYEGKMEE
jgi:hypothetical protein